MPSLKHVLMSYSYKFTNFFFLLNFFFRTLTNDQVTVVAIDMGIKNALFDECLLSDGWLVGLGGLFVFICMWIYTTSVFVTIMTVIAVVFSLGISYFVYTIMFKMTFFPFMNLLAVIVVVGKFSNHIKKNLINFILINYSN